MEPGFPRKPLRFPQWFGIRLCRRRRTGAGFRAFHPVFLLLKFACTTFLKLDHAAEPRLERFATTFPLFRGKRLLLLGKYILKKALSNRRTVPVSGSVG
jgi:hypothetical protein